MYCDINHPVITCGCGSVTNKQSNSNNNKNTELSHIDHLSAVWRASNFKISITSYFVFRRSK